VVSLFFFFLQAKNLSFLNFSLSLCTRVRVLLLLLHLLFVVFCSFLFFFVLFFLLVLVSIRSFFAAENPFSLGLWRKKKGIEKKKRNGENFEKEKEMDSLFLRED